MIYQNILVSIDFSEASKVALRHAIQLARAGKGRLTLLNVGVSPQLVWTDMSHHGVALPESLVTMHQQMGREQEHILRRLANEEIPEDVPWVAVMREGFPPEEILGQLRAGAHDLLVMGTHGRTGLTRVLLGSVAERVLREAPVPVLVVH